MNFWLAFIAGVLSFLSPCVLPLIPSYLAYIGGTSDQKSRLLTIQNSLLFILGFSIIFIALGASASVLGSTLRSHPLTLNRVSGIVVILFGLLMLGLFKFSFLYRDTRISYKGNTRTPWGAILLGMAFAAGWTPCIGPILGSIMILASSSETLNRGILLLLTYALGLGIPFFASALAINSLVSFSARFRQYLPWVERIAGSLLVILGILIFTDRYSLLNRFIPTWLKISL